MKEVTHITTKHKKVFNFIIRRKPGEGNGTSLQYSCLKNPMDGGVL